MPFYFFAWTDEITEHLAEHDVSPEAFEEVVCDPVREETSRTTGRPIAFGFTSTGKYLACIFERLDDETVIPVTAYEPDEDELMKRQAKRASITLSPEKLAELRQVRETIEREEKAEIIERAKVVRRQHQAAQAELARAAELLKEERLAQGLSLADVQDKSGISRAALCRLENLVDANPTIGTLERIAEALGKQLVIGLQDRSPPVS